jgi:hypothetical protein
LDNIKNNRIMAFYIKVTKEVADRLHLTGIRNRTADGNVLLWQADVARFPGDTVFERAKEVGGICLTPQAAKEEIDGTDHPVEVFTPASWGESSEGTDSTETTGEGGAS